MGEQHTLGAVRAAKSCDVSEGGVERIARVGSNTPAHVSYKCEKV